MNTQVSGVAGNRSEYTNSGEQGKESVLGQLMRQTKGEWEGERNCGATLGKFELPLE